MHTLETIEPNSWLIKPHNAYIFYIDLSLIEVDDYVITNSLKILSESEKKQAVSFYHKNDQELYVVAHLLLRKALTSLCPLISFSQWSFVKNKYGRPEISPELYNYYNKKHIHPKIRFNLSHTRNMAACIIVNDIDCGIDVELTTRMNNTLLLAERYFAKNEVADIYSIPSMENKRLRFFEYWTLKESYIKAKGMGLSLPLEKFSFSMKDNLITIKFDDDLEDIPEEWQFFQMKISKEHILACALQIKTASEYNLVIKQVNTIFDKKLFDI